MFSNNSINFNNNTPHSNNNNNNNPFTFQGYSPNNSYNNYFAQNMNPNMSNNFISSSMNVNNMRNNLNYNNPYMNEIINNPNDILYYMNKMNNLYSINNPFILNPYYFLHNNNNNDLFPFNIDDLNSPDKDPNYSKTLVDSLTNKSDNIIDNKSDNIIDNKSDNIIGNISDNIDSIRSPINLSNIIIHVSPDEKEKANTDRFYYHLCNFNSIKEEEIRAKLEKENVDENSIKIVLDNMEIKRREKKKFYINEGLFYSGEEMSLYYPHIIKGNSKNNYASLFLQKDNNKLSENDFQYSNKGEIDDIFMQTLRLRIQEFNEGKNTNDFGFFKNSFGIGYLYTKIPQEIIEDILKSSNITNLKSNLLGNISDINKTYTQNNLEYKIFKDNSNYLKGLTFEQIILNIIMNDLEYEELPRLILYEYFLTIKGERIVFLGEKKEDYPGYNEIDYIFISKKDFTYQPELSGLKVLHHFESNIKDIYEKDIDFSISKGKLYFFELKSSLYKLNDYVDFIRKTINKANEFRALFINKQIITETTPSEIVIIYDDNIRNSFYDIKKKIFALLKFNSHFTISIVYALQSYPYFSHSLNKKQIQNLKEEIEQLKIDSQTRYEQLEKEIKDLKMGKNNNQ